MGFIQIIVCNVYSICTLVFDIVYVMLFLKFSLYLVVWYVRNVWFKVESKRTVCLYYVKNKIKFCVKTLIVYVKW